MTKLGTLLCTGMVFWAAPAYAGFEFTPRSEAPAPAATAEAAMDMPVAADAPMPIIPVEPVSAAPLDSPETDRILANPVSRAVEPVYVRRDRSSIPSTAMKSKPMEAEALLTATANKQPVFPERLVINPYPLEESATHGGDLGAVNVEQAMLEETGLLRPVATPGGSRAGMAARARPVAKAAPRLSAENSEPVLSSMTPLPGDMGDVERLPVADLPAVSAAPAPAPLQPSLAALPATPASSARVEGGGYSDAVGFGRDLPLALALSQVVPAEYSYAFAQNVNVGTMVSWQGGKPWNVVLDEMLAPNGMKAEIQDGQIIIKNLNA